MKVTIIIPNYNGKHFMEPCLASLNEQTCRDFKILIVDNASTDGSLEYMEQTYPDIEVLALDSNYGFSRAVNDLIDSAGDLYTLMGWGVCRGAGRPVSNYTEDDTVFTACAGAAIYRRSVFDEIGFFDESHFAYLEDIDVGYRAMIYGYKNRFCASALVYHVGSGTSGSKYNTFKVKLSARNSVWLNYKNMPLLQLILNFIPLLLGYLVKYLFFCKIGFGTDYKNGIKEGIHGLSKCRKVPFRMEHLGSYIRIEFALIRHTFGYAADWLKRKLLHK